MIKPLILPTQLILGNNIKLNELPNNAPINININNYNINNFHISDNRNDNSTFNFKKKTMQNDVINNFIHKDRSIENNNSKSNNGYNLILNKVNISNNSIKTKKQSFLSIQLLNLDDNTNSRYTINKNTKFKEFKVENLQKMKVHIKERANYKKSSFLDSENTELLDKIIPDKFNLKNHKDKSKVY